MIDVKILRDEPERVQRALNLRQEDLDLKSILELDALRRALIREWEDLQHLRKVRSKEIGQMLRRGEDATSIKGEVQELGDRLKELEQRRQAAETSFQSSVLEIPNIPHESVPAGEDESQNRLVRKWGQSPKFSFEPKPHWEVGEQLDILDFPTGVKLARSRFALLKGAGAKLERALIQFMLDLHTVEKKYKEVLPPFLSNSGCLVGTGQLPKFEADLFKVENWDLYLIPTAEVPLTNIHREEILDERDLPFYYAAYTPCFRSEAGSHGKDVRGLIRQHQFNKVELVKIVSPETSWDELESLTEDAEDVLKRLGLSYRVVSLCTGDLGFAAAKTYDIEVWLPGQGVYKEISSCSNFIDFQSRRAGIRYRRPGKQGIDFVHTLNGSGLAVGRTLVAILEHYQREDGAVSIPGPLRPYMGGVEMIEGAW